MMDRYYIRCADCLSIGVIEVPYQSGWHCSLCAGPIELMGKVVAEDKYEHEHEKSACDRRCTHAIGPICVCKCHCANHGTGRVVVVTTVEHITKVQFIKDNDALTLARSYKASLQQLRDTASMWTRLRQDYSIPYPQRQPLYYNCYRLSQVTKKAVEARTWKARNKHIGAATQIVHDTLQQVEAARG